MDALTLAGVILAIIVIFAIAVTLGRIAAVYLPDRRDTSQFSMVRPRRLGFDMIYDPDEGVTWEAIGRRQYSDGSIDLLLKYGHTKKIVHFTREQLDIKGGNILNIIAPDGPRVFIKLNGHIMDGLLGETDYEVKWDEVLRTLNHYKNAFAFSEQKYNSLEAKFEDAVTAEVERSTTKVIPTTIKATVEALTKQHG